MMARYTIEARPNYVDPTALGRATFQDLMYDWLAYTDVEGGRVDRARNVGMLSADTCKTVEGLLPHRGESPTNRVGRKCSRNPPYPVGAR